MNDKHDFCRNLLRIAKRDFEKEHDKERLRGAWTYRYAGGTAEVQFPNCGFKDKGYHYGQACCSYFIKAQGIENLAERLDDQSKD